MKENLQRRTPADNGIINNPHKFQNPDHKIERFIRKMRVQYSLDN